ncbi:MAG: hypothetical protein B6D34_14115 [Candidatus Brocadia sp. UTAMX1]|nr:MAG: hypothetical protein B6D34_14115 [Candidatus Brocadia sp. UTAMX1]
MYIKVHVYFIGNVLKITKYVKIFFSKREITIMSKPQLPDQVHGAIRIKHYSMRTEEAYVHWIKRFVFFHEKRPSLHMGEHEVSKFLSHLVVERKVSASIQNQTLIALLFLYQEVLKKMGWINNVKRTKKPSHISVFLPRRR